MAHATLKAGGEDLALSHESAALALGLSLWNGAPSRVHVSVDGSGGSRRGSTRWRHATRLDEEDVQLVGGVRVTTPARTVADLACTLTFEEVVCVGDSALRLGGITSREIDEAFGRCSRRRGIARARRAVAFMDGRSESVGESRSRVYLDRHGLPVPDLQVEIAVGARTYRPDPLWKYAGVIGEFDGMAKYTRGKQSSDEVVVQEKLREDALRAAGWNVQRWMWKDLTDDRLALRLRDVLGI